WVYAWAAGVVVLLTGSLARAARTRARLRAARAPLDAATDAAARSAARAAGLRRAPRVLLVRGLESPLVTGPIPPSILLPAAAPRPPRRCLRPPADAPGRLPGVELAMALEHEMAHIARGDLWLALLPSAARHVFFFHPLAWLAEREYAIAREAACDEAVIRRR